MKTALNMKAVELLPDRTIPLIQYAPGPLAAVIGREFLVPADRAKTHEELLREAVDTKGTRFRRKRAAYWRWQREFMSRCTV